MSSQLSACPGHGCDCYQRGAADARRTVEAEFAAERAVLAMLASSLADAGDNMRIFDTCSGSRVEGDPALLPGSVHVVGEASAGLHGL
ncbi:MAG: hypothetical protein ABI898_04915 [Sphingomonadales bacterium]